MVVEKRSFMWNDIETTKDLLNFTVVAKTAAQLVHQSKGEPISIGISGNWGAGKSSLVKMIGLSLRESNPEPNNKYIFLEFNAWLYQGYEDARIALLQAVSDKLLAEAERKKSGIEKAMDFAKRVNWLHLAKLATPVASGALLGGTLGGPLGAIIGAVGGLVKSDGNPSTEDLDRLKDAYLALKPELPGLLKERKVQSLPQEIENLRLSFSELLKELEITLVVLVDDLDRCLPETAISTLEAMRLLLFIPNTAFIIAADEQMIRNSVRSHFINVDISDEHVTSYFDKLIQIPLRVPRLGVAEVKGYLVLLLAELASRKQLISEEALFRAEKVILKAVSQSWDGGLTRKTIEGAFGDDATKLNMEIDIADQIAGIMVSSDRIGGNPRLIKRFLNNLLIRDTIAKSQGITIAFDQLIKLQLFERCAIPAAFEYLVKNINHEDGRCNILVDIETALSKGEQAEILDESWKSPFVSEWLKLSPTLGEKDLRPLLYLSRDKAIILAGYDEISQEARALLDALLEAKNIIQPLIDQLKAIGEIEAERILNRIMRQARATQWEPETLIQALHITKAHSVLGVNFVGFLSEIPSNKRSALIIPYLREEEWAERMLKQWFEDSQTPQVVKNAIKALERKK
ncbi:MAG: KAP P-loop protein [Fusobacteria bacterium]|nr:MAG: KAP P-loop protein [Fusobacteriota bacterium]KAF0228607.1 MAG: KAP P-loop [Fusobacteriota bacterium]